MLKNELENEIEKWTGKLDERLPKVKPADENGKEIYDNAKAYMEDSKHFREEDMLIKSYEALIWAWAFLEIGEKFDHLSGKNKLDT